MTAFIKTNSPIYKDDNDNPNLNGGPIEGYDIAVYKVKTDFKLGTPPKYLFYNASDPLHKAFYTLYYNNFKSHIWPACFPKDDDDDYATKKGFVAGWLDSPGTLQDPLKLGIESLSYDGLR